MQVQLNMRELFKKASS